MQVWHHGWWYRMRVTQPFQFQPGTSQETNISCAAASNCFFVHLLMIILRIQCLFSIFGQSFPPIRNVLHIFDHVAHAAQGILLSYHKILVLHVGCTSRSKWIRGGDLAWCSSKLINPLTASCFSFMMGASFDMDYGVAYGTTTGHRCYHYPSYLLPIVTMLLTC